MAWKAEKLQICLKYKGCYTGLYQRTKCGKLISIWQSKYLIRPSPSTQSCSPMIRVGRQPRLTHSCPAAFLGWRHKGHTGFPQWACLSLFLRHDNSWICISAIDISIHNPDMHEESQHTHPGLRSDSMSIRCNTVDMKRMQNIKHGTNKRWDAVMHAHMHTFPL